MSDEAHAAVPGDSGASFGRRLIRLERGAKNVLIGGADTLVLALALWSSFVVRLEDPTPDRLIAQSWLLVAVPLGGVCILFALGTYRTVLRFMNERAMWALARGAIGCVLVYVLLATFLRAEAIPRSTYLLYGVFVFGGLVGMRLLVRAWLPRADTALVHRSRRAALIYGAGEAGYQLLRMLEASHGLRIVAFVDDDPGKQGTQVSGLKVHAPDALESLIHRHGVVQVLLAMPSVHRLQRRAILQRLEPFRIAVRTVPRLADIASGAQPLDELQEVTVDDLLERNPVDPDPELLDRRIRGQSVLVTGAGGSIGSELCRQIIERDPARLVLFEQSEFALYRVERELRARLEARDERQDTAVTLVAVLGNVLDEALVARTLELHAVETVYHAAAYKHVPMVEANPAQGVLNNTFGTLALVRAAMGSGVRHVVLVSSDKAVRPANVMGASKRIAEMVLQALADEECTCQLSMVRFGNVLDSSGSVVPLFREQIRTGGPVTVTDPEVIRYFMTMSEASQLVVQASAMAEGGEVFVLDMGEPVRIVDLARRMIRLSGRSVRDGEDPEGDIEIRVTDLRSGEKLYEELLIDGDVEPTRNAMILRARESFLPWHQLEPRLDSLRQACDAGDASAIRRVLAELLGADAAAFDTPA